MKKCLKRTKNIKNHKHIKNHNHTTCYCLDRMRTSLLPISGRFCFFTPIFGPKNQNFQKIKKRLEILSFYILLGV